MKKSLYIPLIKLLQPQGVNVDFEKNQICASANGRQLVLFLAEEGLSETSYYPLIHPDQLIRSPEKIAALILSQLKLNRSVFARNCTVARIDKPNAEKFIDKYHLLNSTQSGFNLGLFLKEELIAVASFSKGRKMNRLREDQRSFELIRFCSKSGITVTGGLSKLLKKFCEEKNAGDIMTYVDKNLSDGSSFIRAGFKKHSETEANYFLVNRKTFERIYNPAESKFDEDKFYLSRNAGSVKLVFTPGE